MSKSIDQLLVEAGQLIDDDKFDEAITTLETVTKLEPALVNAYLQIGRSHWEMHRWNMAQKSFHNALRIGPNDGDAKWTTGLMELQLGNFNIGWPLYEERWNSPSFKSPPLKTKLPKWEPDKRYKSVLVWCEQGIGDQLIYASLLGALKKNVEKITVLIDVRLINMLSRAHPDIKFVTHDTKIKNSEYDSQIPIASIGKYFINNVSDIKNHRSVGYVYPDRSRLDHLRYELKLQPDDFLIGLSWASTAPRIGQQKSVKLEELLGLWDIPNAKIVSLQYGPPDYEIEPFEKSTGKVIHQTTVNNFFDLEGTLAIMSMCNAVISVSNANVHLAGALGVPTYVLDANKLWYWNHKEGRTSLFYPTVKLFPRKNIKASWTEQVSELIVELKKQKETFV